MPFMFKSPWWWGRRGLSTGVLDAYGGGSVTPRCDSADGQEVTLVFTGRDVPGAGTWLTPQFTFLGDPTCYVQMICDGASWFPIMYWDSGAQSKSGTVTETSPGVWTFLITGIDFGNGCVYQLGGSWAEADC